MMRIQRFILISLLLVSATIRAQGDSIAIREVVVDALLRDFSEGQRVITLPDSVLQRDPGSVTRLLQFHTPIYFKENGFGMVSSPSFRGTTTQQTAVVWNGINLNSALNGQTDFGALNLAGNVSVRPGGGSVLFGSSAIGGSIHYNSSLSFESPLKQTVNFQYGSFNTANASYGIAAGLGKIGFNIRAFRNSSDNDYPLRMGGNNLNGQFYSTGFDAVAGVRFDNVHSLRFYSRLFEGERHFSVILPSETKTKYRDLTASNMLEWVSRYDRVTTTAKLAFLNLQYKFYENLTAEPQVGKTETVLARYDAAWKISDNLELHPVAEFSSVKGWGTNTREGTRGVFSGSVLAKYRAAESLWFEGGLRQESTSAYESPLLFSGAAIFKRNWYTLRINGSRNFRVPTFNDLFWLTGGNDSLKPESSWQAEIGQQVNFGPMELSVTAYAINITDMIQWRPGATTLWYPENVYEVYVRGAEAILKYGKRFGKNHLQISGTYAYTKSENRETGKQLIFVPVHKGTLATGYAYNRFELTAESLFNGEVFTRSDNNPRYNLDGYAVVNGGFAYVFDRENSSKIGVNIRNLFDIEYMTQVRRPYPGRHYAINLILNF